MPKVSPLQAGVAGVLASVVGAVGYDRYAVRQILADGVAEARVRGDCRIPATQRLPRVGVVVGEEPGLDTHLAALVAKYVRPVLQAGAWDEADLGPPSTAAANVETSVLHRHANHRRTRAEDAAAVVLATSDLERQFRRRECDAFLCLGRAAHDAANKGHALALANLPKPAKSWFSTPAEPTDWHPPVHSVAPLPPLDLISRVFLQRRIAQPIVASALAVVLEDPADPPAIPISKPPTQ